MRVATRSLVAVVVSLGLVLATAPFAGAFTAITPPMKMAGTGTMPWTPGVAYPWVVWNDDGVGGEVIRWANLETGATGDIACGEAMFPRIDGNRVLYLANKAPTPDPYLWDVYVNDLSTGVERNITSSMRDRDQNMMDISGDWLCWRELEASYPPGYEMTYPTASHPLGYGDLKAFNLTTGVTWTVGVPGASNELMPQVWGDTMVYVSKAGAAWEMRKFDLVTGADTRLFGAEFGDPGFSDLQGDELVWIDDATHEIHLYDMADGTDRVIGPEGADHWPGSYPPPVIRGDTVVWQEDFDAEPWPRGGITALDLATDQSLRYVAPDGDVWEHRTDGEWVVFEFTPDSGDTEIQLARLGDGAPVGAGTAVSTVDTATGVSVGFGSVSLPGFVQVATGTAPAPLPGGYSLEGQTCDVTFNGRFVDTATVGVPYDEATISVPESDLKLFHFDGAAWEDVTVSVDESANIVYGASATLSPFAIGAPAATGGVAVPAGTDVEVVFPNGVELVFAEVTGAGTASATPIAPVHAGVDGATIPAGRYYDINTDAAFTGPVTVTLPYDEGSSADPTRLKMRHWDGGAGVPDDITVSVDTDARTVTGTTNSFSDFWIEDPPGSGNWVNIGADASVPAAGWALAVAAVAALVWRRRRAA